MTIGLPSQTVLPEQFFGDDAGRAFGLERSGHARRPGNTLAMPYCWPTT